MLREEIVAEIKKIAARNSGSPPGSTMFVSLTGIGESKWRGVYWARWGDALTEAGFSANSWVGKTDDERIFRALSEATRNFGRLPTKSEYQLYRRGKDDLPSDRVIFNSTSRRQEILKGLRDWISTNPDCIDVAPHIPEQSDDGSVSNEKSRDGFVYLTKSGAHYKIGRSDELERRVKEIRISLPEKATLVHTIRTDDPPGIESYWHHRFADRRANGEWFKLTPRDVTAFKKRRFQ